MNDSRRETGTPAGAALDRRLKRYGSRYGRSWKSVDKMNLHPRPPRPHGRERCAEPAYKKVQSVIDTDDNAQNETRRCRPDRGGSAHVARSCGLPVPYPALPTHRAPERSGIPNERNETRIRAARTETRTGDRSPNSYRYAVAPGSQDHPRQRPARSYRGQSVNW